MYWHIHWHIHSMSQSKVASTAMLIINLFVSGINMLSRSLYMLHVKEYKVDLF